MARIKVEITGDQGSGKTLLASFLYDAMMSHRVVASVGRDVDGVLLQDLRRHIVMRQTEIEISDGDNSVVLLPYRSIEDL